MWQFIIGFFVGGFSSICFMSIFICIKHNDDKVIQDYVKSMRDATPEETESIHNYIKSISEPTGYSIFDDWPEQEDNNGKCNDNSDQCQN